MRNRNFLKAGDFLSRKNNSSIKEWMEIKDIIKDKNGDVKLDMLYFEGYSIRRQYLSILFEHNKGGLYVTKY